MKIFFLTLWVLLAVFLDMRLACGTTVRVSVDSSWQEHDGVWAINGRMSGDGRYVAFVSDADLAPGTPTGCINDVYVRDRIAQTTELVSGGSGLATVGCDSRLGDISENGRFVVFTSNADNLPGDQTSEWEEIYVKDRLTGAVTQLDHGLGNIFLISPVISADSRFIGFTAVDPDDVTPIYRTYVTDRVNGGSELISIGHDGSPSNCFSTSVQLSANGRFAAFVSCATNLVVGITDGASHVYVRDRWLQQTSLASKATDGTPANNFCSWPSISASGRVLTFTSSATNLTAHVNSGSQPQVYLHELGSGETTLVSETVAGTVSSGSSSPRISSDGRYVCFSSTDSGLVLNDFNSFMDILVYDHLSGHVNLVSRDVSGGDANGRSEECDLSDNGWVTFRSDATDMVSNDTNNNTDLFIRQLGLHTQVNDNASDSGDAYHPFISAYGKFLTFASDAPDLVSGDSNDKIDIFTVNGILGKTKRIDINWSGSGEESNDHSLYPTISPGGDFVLFTTPADNLVSWDYPDTYDVLLFKNFTNELNLVSSSLLGFPANGNSAGHGISDKGQVTVFGSTADDIISSDTNNHADVFIHNRTTGETTSPTVRGFVLVGGFPYLVPSNGDSGVPVISGDGRFIAFQSNASNLIHDDTEGYTDVFLYDRAGGSLSRISIAPDGSGGNGNSTSPSISEDGRFVAYMSQADNLLGASTTDPLHVSDIFVYDRLSGSTQSPTNFFFPRGAEGFLARQDYANGASSEPRISRDGHFVAFRSAASNLVVGDTNSLTDVFLWDRENEITRLASLAPDGRGANNESIEPTLTHSGHTLSMRSLATNLNYNSSLISVFEPAGPKWDVFTSPIGKPPASYCSGSTATVENQVFLNGNDVLCLSGKYLVAGAINFPTGTHLESGTRVEFRSPNINLRGGFSIAKGAEFSAGP